MHVTAERADQKGNSLASYSPDGALPKSFQQVETLMKTIKTSFLFGFICLVGTLVAMKAQGPATVRVGGSSLRANGQVAQGFEYSGACPVDLKFGWGLIATEAATASYSFARNDGGHPPSGSVDLPAGRSKPVYLDWHLGANNAKFANYKGWVEIHIESPNQVSQKISFTLHCGSASM
jgi:hypothetical protein